VNAENEKPKPTEKPSRSLPGYFSEPWGAAGAWGAADEGHGVVLPLRDTCVSMRDFSTNGRKAPQ